jgi:hypothetical protein
MLMPLKHYFRKSYTLCWIFAALALIIGLGAGDDLVDINIYDTYYLISSRFLGTLVTIALAVMGLGYYLMARFQKKLISWLTGIHLFLTLGGIVLIGLVCFVLSLTESFGELISTDAMVLLENIILLSIVVVIMAQPIYVINLLLGMFRSE